jgi:4-amino-4-deoxy-L-arabinose transferase-like glycosyltransferase
MPIRHHLILLLYGVVLLIVPLNDGTVLSRHEVYTAEPARELLAGQMPWAVQTFAGEFRTNKPPTMSWLIAACMTIFDSRAEWVARLPSAIAGVITALAIGVIAQRLLKHPLAGLLAGLITLTMAWLQIQAKLAQADMLMVASVTLAMLALVPRNDDAESEPKPVTAAALLFWLATAAGFLLKFVAIFITIPAAIMFAFWAKDARTKRILRHPLALTLFVLILVAWPIAAYVTYPRIVETWDDQTLDRITGDIHNDTRPPITAVQYIAEFFYFFWTIPWVVLPATPAIIIGLWTGLDHAKSRTGKLLLSWVTPFLLLITLSAIKYKHYSFPLLPALSVVAAYGTIVWMRSLKRPKLATPLLAAWFIGCGVVILWLKLSVIPRSDSNRSYVDLAHQANAIAPDDQPIRMIGLGEQPIAYYLEPIPKRIDALANVPTDQTFYAVIRRQAAEQLRATHTLEVLIDVPPRRPGDNPMVFVRFN